MHGVALSAFGTTLVRALAWVSVCMSWNRSGGVRSTVALKKARKKIKETGQGGTMPLKALRTARIDQ